MSRHVLIFGGAFDPPHNGHATMIISALEKKIADEIWIVPVGIHAFDKQMAPAHSRLEMCILLKRSVIKDHPELESKIKVEPYEIMINQMNYSYETLLALKEQHPDTTFSLMIGSDLAMDFLLWKYADKILEKHQVWVYPREGYPLEDIPHDLEKITGVTIVPVASRQIRKRLQEGNSITDLVPTEIAQYSEKNHLYAQH